MKTSSGLNLRFINSLDNALKLYKKHMQSGLLKHGIDITIDQWQVLDVIVNSKDIKQTEIAEKTSKDPASVTRIIEILNKKGYVARQVDPNNRRKMILGVSNHGEKEYIKAAEVIIECSEKVLGGLNEKRMKKIRKVFKSISKNCNN